MPHQSTKPPLPVSTKRRREIVCKTSKKYKPASKRSMKVPPPPPTPSLPSKSTSKEETTKENRDDDEAYDVEVLDFLISLRKGNANEEEEWSFDLEEDDDLYTETEEGLSSSLEDGLFGLAYVGKT
mmetsp:Transcript_13637/g.19081  ORF Transcript_13637/g.19081 Transcript_13637/m.19081 type:complete len:126 (+) Transcript_13637:153-530(+)